MNRKFIFILCSFILSANMLIAQSITYKDLYGKWNVGDWIILNTTQQTSQEKKDFEKLKKKCLKSKFTIDSLIKNNCSECEFSLCKNPFDNSTQTAELPIAEDDENTKRYPGNEIEERNVVGKTFIKLLDKNYVANKITMIKTNCKTESGTNIRILVISKKKIALYSGEDIIILTR